MCCETRACKYTCLIAYFIELHVITSFSCLRFLLKATLNYFDVLFALLFIRLVNIGHYLVDVLAYKRMNNYRV